MVNELTQKVLDVLYNENVDKDNVLETLSLIYRELEVSLWHTIKMSSSVFYSLKDVVWYNVEHLHNNGEVKGVSDLRYLGSKFSTLIYCCNDSNVIKNEEVKKLSVELDSIIKLWDKDWNFVTLYTKSNEGWRGGSENPSKVIIYDARTESPTRYGYNSNYGNILDKDGKTIKKLDTETVLCSVDVPIGEYANGQILYNALFQLSQSCKYAIETNRDIRIDFE